MLGQSQKHGEYTEDTQGHTDRERGAETKTDTERQKELFDLLLSATSVNIQYLLITG